MPPTCPHHQPVPDTIEPPPKICPQPGPGSSQAPGSMFVGGRQGVGGGAVCSKWPNSPNFPSAAGGLLAGGGAALRPATASAAPRSRLAGKWVSVQRTAVQRLYSARLYTHPAYLQCNLLKSNCVELAAVGLYKHPPPARARQSGMYLFIFKCSSV